jgi:hypothetical protein
VLGRAVGRAGRALKTRKLPRPALAAGHADALRGAFGVVRPAVPVRQQRRATAVGVRGLVADAMLGS